jgi:hypothetical protein
MLTYRLMPSAMLVASLAFFGFILAGVAQEKPAPTPATKSAAVSRIVARLMLQDHADQSVKWADVTIDAQKKLALGSLGAITGAKKLDPEKQKLVQMQESQGLVVVGVRDEQEGEFESGWMLLDTGVRFQNHGDHGHWKYREPPKVLAIRLDKEQGNPAHVYCYDGRFFLANDRKNGYTRIDPADYLRQPPKPRATFFPGGGNHITLAVAGNQVGYAAWIDGGGPDAGRVDVTRLSSTEASTANYQFHLASGVIHGAATAEGKVFFAPSNGIDWVKIDESAALKPEQVKIHHIDLGKQEDKPCRTGAFSTHGRHLLCVTGKAPQSRLVILDAAAQTPAPHFLDLNIKTGSKATTPRIVVAADKKPYALIFHDHDEDSENEDQLDVFALDPNGDGRFADAAYLKSIAVGSSDVDGHFGHHSVAFDAHGRYAFVSNPGDATLQVLSTTTWDELAQFPVEGKPADIIAIGGR